MLGNLLDTAGSLFHDNIHDHRLIRCQDLVISTLITLSSAPDINNVYLTMQSAVQSLCASVHCRIVTKKSDQGSDQQQVIFSISGDKVGVTLEIDQRQIRRTTRLVYVETESTSDQCDDIVHRSLQTLAQAATQQCVLIRRQQQIASDAQVATGLLALRRQWQQIRPRQALSMTMLESFLKTTQDLVQAERIVAIVADHHENRLAVISTSMEDPIQGHSDFSMNEGILGAAMTAKRAIVANNVQEHRAYRPKVDPFTDSTMKQIICQPIFDRSLHVVGLIVAINHVNDEMEPSDSLMNMDIHHGFADRNTDLLDQCCTEMNDFLLFHFTEISTRRATSSNIGAFSLVQSYLGRSISERRLSDDEDEVGPDSNQMISASRSCSTTSQAAVYANARIEQTMSLAKRLSLTSTPEGQLDTLNFNVFDSSLEQLQVLCLTMMSKLDVFNRFDCDIAMSMVNEIRQQYQDQPFHNFRHAVSVMHMTYLFITRHDDVRATLGIEKVFAALVAALGHDLGHPGHTNQFEMNSDSELCQRYNGKSVLENYHAACLMKILRNTATDPFQHLEPAVRRSLREAMIDAILGTDMCKHFVFNKRLEAMDDRNVLLSPTSFADQNFLMETIVHAADLSAQGYDTPIAVEWETRISSEFRQQATLETSLGFPVATFMTDLDNDKHRAELQVSFIDFVLHPFWKEVARLFPGVADVYHNIILRSRQYYTILKNDGKDAAMAYLSTQISSAAILATHSLRAHTFPTAQRNGSNCSMSDIPSAIIESGSGPGTELNRGPGIRASSVAIKANSQPSHTRFKTALMNRIIDK